MSFIRLCWAVSPMRVHTVGSHWTWSSVRLTQEHKGVARRWGAWQNQTRLVVLFFCLNQVVLWELLCVCLLYCGKLWHMLYTARLLNTQKHTHQRLYRCSVSARLTEEGPTLFGTSCLRHFSCCGWYPPELLTACTQLWFLETQAASLSLSLYDDTLHTY